MIKYKSCTIWYDPPPIGTRECDYQWVHEEYDGAPEYLYDPPSDNRCGYGPSVEDCKNQIDDLESEF